MSKFNSSVLLICALIYSILVSFNQIEIAFFIPILFLMFFEYRNLFKILKKLIFLNLFIVMIFVVLALQGDMQNAVNIYIRTNLIILFNLILFSHSNGFDIVRGLNGLNFPSQIVSSVYFTLKMIETLKEELKNIKFTLKARGFRANSSMFAYETYGNLFGHIFVKSIRKSNALRDSFELRGFRGEIYLVSSNKISIYDVSLLIIVISIMLNMVV